MDLKRNTWLTLEECKEWLNIKPEDTKRDEVIKRLINVACARIGNYIDGPVLVQQFTEFFDGNSANVIVPSHRPIIEIEEIKIDFNRNFDSATQLQTSSFALRGLPAMSQLSTDVVIKIQGTDIVLVDDQNAAILGKLFSGSTIQSIKIIYKAGWGESPKDLPDDIVHATLMLVEYLYILKENRELNIKSKDTNGQSYTRDSGIPKEIMQMIEDYIDCSFGPANVPQKNSTSF